MFHLPDSLTIMNVQQVQEELFLYFRELQDENAGEMILNGEQVKDLDAAGLQLLISAWKSCRQKKMNCRIIHPSYLIKDLLNISGAADIFAKEENAGG